MQIKKFEAPTIQEALETIKRELGPEAIILQTRSNKNAFGLMSRDSVEVTAAVSERSLQKKRYVENKLPDSAKDTVKRMPAQRQAELYDKYSGAPPRGAASGAPGGGQARAQPAPTAASPRREAPVGGHLEAALGAAQDRVEVSSRTPIRYVEIDEHELSGGSPASPPARERDRGSGALPPRGSFLPVEEEVRHLKRMIEELKSAQDSRGLGGAGPQALLSQASVVAASPGALSTPALHDAFEQLVLNGVEKRHALRLLKQVSFELGEDRGQSPDDVLDQLAGELMRTTRVQAPLLPIPRRPEPANAPEPEVVAEGRKPGVAPAVIALVGPTGVGKTTTIAKMASEALLRRGQRVGLVSVDSHKIAAFDQLGTYAKILNVPFRSVTSSDELSAAIKDFQGLDLVLIDTTGRSQRDPGSLRELQGLLKVVPDLRSQLVLSVTTRDNELYDMASRFGVFRPEGITFSKLDEATLYGSIYNVHQKANLPLLYFTTGQRVPEDIEEATPERVAALILDL